MRATIGVMLIALAGYACVEQPPTAPEVHAAPPELTGTLDWRGRGYRAFTLLMSGPESSPSEAWGLFQVRAGLAPPNPCSVRGRRGVSALTLCGIIYNPVEERLDAVTFEVMQTGADGPVILRGFVSAPPNPCNIALLRGVLPADLSDVESVVAILETDVGPVVSNGVGWPGAFPAAPPNPCVLDVTLG